MQIVELAYVGGCSDRSTYLVKYKLKFRIHSYLFSIKLPISLGRFAEKLNDKDLKKAMIVKKQLITEILAL